MRSRLAWRAPLAALALALAGCVTTAQYDGVVAERDSLRERTSQLDASVQALTAERDALAGQVEDQRTQSEAAVRDATRQRGDCEAQLADRAAKLDELHATYEGLVKDLEGEVSKSNTQMEQLREGLRMTLPAGSLFTSGSADLSRDGERVLADVAKNLRRDAYADYQILVEGHTDGAAIRGALAQRFPTNWELAGARAARVVRTLEQDGVDPKRLAAVSRGAEQPVGPEDTAEGRAANRRIEIRLIPRPGAEATGMPPPLEPPAAAKDGAAAP
jgi:chemotaxis protein MotB